MNFYHILLITLVSYTSAYPANFFLNPIRLTALQFPIQSQYHAQDELGQYSYGYNTPYISKNEIRTADGTTRGDYAYLDPNGLVQNVRYTADSSNGFRVAASNLPQPPVANLMPPAPVKDTPDVEKAKMDHLKAVEQKLMEINTMPPQNLVAPTPTVPIFTSLALQPSLRIAPIIYPTIAYNSLILPSASTQYHAQDDAGRYSYGYSNQISSKAESRALDGITRGGYAYVDPRGLVQTVKYVADEQNGFRVAASNLPVAPTASQQMQMAADTPDIQAAKASLEQVRQETKQRLSAASDS